jgi:hypothetical protein
VSCGCCSCWSGPTECLPCMLGCPHTWGETDETVTDQTDAEQETEGT